MPERLIITGGSAPFGPSLIALIGSLNVNWPGHPPVRVYDIGLDTATLATLEDAGIETVRVPPFVPHWRKHFTWKLWCWNEAPARDIIWMDAGLVVMQPLPEVLLALDTIGYFVVPTYYPLVQNASLAACEGCGVPPSAREHRMTLAAGGAGLRKDATVGRIVEEALEVAITERYIEATEPLHRHDQAVLSLLMYKHLGEPILADGLVYLGWESPEQVPGQKVWVHRRSLTPEDQAYFHAHVATSGEPRRPSVPPPPTPIERTLVQRVGLAVYKARQRVRPDPEPPRPGFTVPYDGIRD